MGLFGGGDKKKTCSFCGGKAGFFGSTTLQDGEKICNKCSQGVSSFVDLAQLDTAGVSHQKEVHQRMAEFVRASGMAENGATHPRWPTYRSFPMGRVMIDPGLGLFAMQDLAQEGAPVEVIRLDQLASYTPRTENPFLHKADGYALARVGFRVILQNHPYLSEAEVIFAKRVVEGDVAELVADVNDLASRFDKAIGLPEVAGLATSVAGAFGVQTDIGRKVEPTSATRLAEVTALANAAEEKYGAMHR